MFLFSDKGKRDPENSPSGRLSSKRALETGLFFRLLPYQILLIVISAVNGIVDSLYASNAIGKEAMSAIGLYGPLNHFLYAASIMLVSGSQMLYGRYLAKDRKRIQSIFSVTLFVSVMLSLFTVLVLVIGASLRWTRVLVSEETVLQSLNAYIYGQSVGMTSSCGCGTTAFPSTPLNVQAREKPRTGSKISASVSRTLLPRISSIRTFWV